MIPTQTGQLRHRIAFDKREDVNPDAPLDLGNTTSQFIEQFIVAAKVEARFGGEAVTAARLTGQQPVNITVRQSTQTRLIGVDWRARDVRSGTVYAIRSIVDPDDRRAWLEILCQTGVAA
jgi:head-tail adaptor